MPGAAVLLRAVQQPAVHIPDHRAGSDARLRCARHRLGAPLARDITTSATLRRQRGRAPRPYTLTAWLAHPQTCSINQFLVSPRPLPGRLLHGAKQGLRYPLLVPASVETCARTGVLTLYLALCVLMNTQYRNAHRIANVPRPPGRAPGDMTRQ